jgi:DNA-binding beta-propeller fold protein YncE
MMRTSVMRTCAILSLAFVLGDRPLDAGMIFWTNEGAGTIQGARADGSGTTVARDVGTPQGIALGQATGQIYWTDYRSLTIDRMNPDGTGLTVLDHVNGEPRGIAVDQAGGKMFWALTGGGYPTIQSANLDGSGVHTLVQSLYGTGQMWQSIGVALDPLHQKVYWTQPLGLVGESGGSGSIIASANYDGSGIKEVVKGPGAFMMAVDPVHGKLYWTQANEVWRSNLDGSGAQDLLTSPLLGGTRGIALDVAGDRMFVVDNGTGSIFTAALDGSGIRTIETGLYFPTGIAYRADISTVPEPSSLALACAAVPMGLIVAWRRRRRRASA